MVLTKLVRHLVVFGCDKEVIAIRLEAMAFRVELSYTLDVAEKMHGQDSK